MSRRPQDWDVNSSPMVKNMKNYGPLTQDTVAELYSSCAHLLSDDHRNYLEAMLRGEAETDSLLDLEMFFRLVTIYATQAVMWSLEERKVTKDIGSILGEVRQSAVAIENMRTKRVEVKKEKVEDEQGVGINTRKSALDFFETLPRRLSEEGKGEGS